MRWGKRRHVIHHDLCWNPSNLEQRTGRLDRIGCKAELCQKPIQVYQPFLAGSADEKMFRVVRDRERWFQVVMGQKFEFDEAASEAIADRVPLPDELAKELTFDLRRWGCSATASSPAFYTKPAHQESAGTQRNVSRRAVAQCEELLRAS